MRKLHVEHTTDFVSHLDIDTEQFLEDSIIAAFRVNGVRLPAFYQHSLQISQRRDRKIQARAPRYGCEFLKGPEQLVEMVIELVKPFYHVLCVVFDFGAYCSRMFVCSEIDRPHVGDSAGSFGMVI